MRNSEKTPEISRLIEFMRLKNLKATELADSIDVPHRTLTNFIWNNRPLSGAVMRKLNEVHGVSIDWLLSGDGEACPNDPIVDRPEPLIPFYETMDSKDFSDVWWLFARSTEQALMQSGAVPGLDYSRLDVFRLCAPMVLEFTRNRDIDPVAKKNIL